MAVTQTNGIFICLRRKHIVLLVMHKIDAVGQIQQNARDMNLNGLIVLKVVTLSKRIATLQSKSLWSFLQFLISVRQSATYGNTSYNNVFHTHIDPSLNQVIKVYSQLKDVHIFFVPFRKGKTNVQRDSRRILLLNMSKSNLGAIT